MKGTYFYLGYQDKVYMISKHLIVDVFGVYAERCIKDPKGQVSKTIALKALQSWYNCTHKFCRRLVECKEFGFVIF
jgi:hypothetical protein